jgi:hypothetical protein
MASNPPTPEELIRAEAEADRITAAYRKGSATYVESFDALAEARRMRESILDWYRSKAKV